MTMKHYVTDRELFKSYPESVKEIILGAGCFWGVERLFWELPGVWTTYVSYSGGRRENPTYEEVCMGVTGHVETVNVFYDQKQIKFETILKTFWECHDPTQGMRQGNDIGSQYRSVIFLNSELHKDESLSSLETYQHELELNGYGPITTEISMMKNYFLAEEYHQQYLAKNPNGYCGLGGTGCSFPNN